MSHITLGTTTVRDIECVRAAAERLGLRLEKRSNYRWYGRYVGDTALPAGLRAEDMGRNAEYVLTPTAEACKKHKIDPNQVYEIGLIPHPERPGEYLLAYDYWRGGFGIEKLVGERVVENGNETVAPLLLMHYQMQQDAMIAQALGDQIQFEEQPDGSWVSITVPNPDRLRS